MASRGAKLSPAVVGAIPNVWLVGRHAAMVTAGGQLLMDPFRDSARILCLEANDDLVEWMSEKGWTRAQPADGISDLCSLVNRLDSNYYHWIVESCGKIEALDYLARNAGIFPKILIRRGGPAFIRNSLDLLGIHRERVVEWDPKGPPTHVSRLVLPSRPGNEVICSSASLNWLRSRFLRSAGLNTDSLTPEKRLYIPRKKGGWRYVVNEDALIGRLKEDGFEIVPAEHLDLTDQIKLFSQARLIVGLHGAGLTNILFAPNAALLELFGTYGDGAWFTMASGLRLPYRSFQCQPDGDNVFVDVDLLMNEISDFEDCLLTQRNSEYCAVPSLS